MDGLFFVISKILGPLAQPANALLVLAILGAALWRRRARNGGGLGFHLTAAALAALLAIAVLPVGKWLLLPLENRFAQQDAAAGKLDGIVLLGGTVEPWLSAARGTPQVNGSAERLIEFVTRGRAYPEAKLVFTGGTGSLSRPEEREAHSIPRLLAAMGLDPARVTIEANSRNTAENAAFTRALVAPKPGETWALITSASHMPRAVGVFRQAGWPVVPVPVDFRTDGRWNVELGFSLARGLELVSVAAHEWLGLIAYRLSGRSDSLFPGPAPPSAPEGSDEALD
jgi:uncharacterized SAM-binding protein YcdF (DUF218 family)